MMYVIWLIIFYCYYECEAIWLSVPSSGTKCVSEEIHNNVVVLANYYVIADYPTPLNASISIQVTSPQGNYLHSKENVTHGQFAFSTNDAGNYQACFRVDSHNPKHSPVNVNLDWKTGVATKDWASVARKENIQGVELELLKIEGAVEAVHQNLLYLRGREAQMRSTSEVTNTRVAMCSIMSLAVYIAVSVMQLLYLKQYFSKKKLI